MFQKVVGLARYLAPPLNTASSGLPVVFLWFKLF